MAVIRRRLKSGHRKSQDLECCCSPPITARIPFEINLSLGTFTTMASLLLSAALLLLSTGAGNAFLGTSLRSFVPPSARSADASTSRLQMVAPDAKVCLVTGSSRGLGKAIALELGKSGQKVVINYVSDSSKESADAAVAEIKALGGDAIAVQADSTFGLLDATVW
jgi:short chain dehydrogenase